MTVIDIINQILFMRETLKKMDETITKSLDLLDDPETPNKSADILRGEQNMIIMMKQWIDLLLEDFWKSEDRAESLTDLLSLNEKR